METLTIVLTIIQVIFAVLLTIVVLFQSGKSAGLSGAIGGGSDSFMSKNRGSSWDAKLAKGTKWIATVFIILTFALCLL